MKINNLGPTGINPYKKQMNKMAAVESKASKADKVEISSEAKQLQETSPVTVARQERVDALTKQVQSGNYKIDANAIAKSVYDFYTK
ncbi:flagellar biosynthesis anti-sigma factor FlgM [Bacillus luteolus]|uniref:Negative regulator of flagellin synthesis n=1 Tax=Litchfieldia luteola TaxID=682179 RepID=A0ABR9QEY4_9BACI|nr:flagellar biosynthesis anti-sigma factor FlgM [Cytobacillus luteolus]MBE4907057.1 flagellar biosynthesis anti-sigma factor FlgM [Cytobacillus luteolus]MBP1943476.1 negative regulator of flagellin synthesis FlgM [Cytobacillus luteolus]